MITLGLKPFNGKRQEEQENDLSEVRCFPVPRADRLQSKMATRPFERVYSLDNERKHQSIKPASFSELLTSKFPCRVNIGIVLLSYLVTIVLLEMVIINLFFFFSQSSH